ncbi:MAG: hypothetical protein AVDCRST_MAG64-1285 [uncultured Phycisphaerae bacterium]|uniref:Uncharacterized protein n=1 Tax=uncultured Phycisphaerae bacterium TaxID=904963 RepID=A0A6J4NVM6_9BACT|nr:MAG: hypothetical protein AVDCRST_MAG64-1285 [uncultured Phycisphaerae bacterium]
MTRKLSIPLAVAALAVGGVLLGPAFAEDDDVAAPAAAQGEQADAKETAAAAPSFPPGVKVDDDPEEERGALFGTFADATKAVLTKDGFDDFVERLVDQDRNRIGEDGFAEKKFADLNATAQAIRTAWKDKFGDEFDVEEEQAFAKLAVAVGKIDDPKAMASAWPVPPVTADPSGAPAGEDAIPAGATETAGNEDPDLNSNIEKGRGVAIATLPASHGLPALNVSLIHEVPGWRVDVPNALTGRQLHDGLLKHLTHVADTQAQWPADRDEAALMIAHHVLLGAYGVDVEPVKGDERAKDAPGASPAE